MPYCLWQGNCSLFHYMKRYFILAVFAAVALFACSCKKDGVELFEGNYSFKTSGTVFAHRISEITDTTSTVPDSLTLKLVTESGQMDITPTSVGNGLLVTMNVTGGDLVVLQADVDGDELVVRPSSRNLSFTISSPESNLVGTMLSHGIEPELTVSGNARRYDDIVMFSFCCSGTFSMDDTVYEIHDSRIDCRAKLNK